MRDRSGERSLVMKFGGTSVADADAMRRVIGIVASVGGEKPIVVTSACAGITNDLVECGKRCEALDNEGALEIVEAIAVRHRALLDDCCPTASEHRCDEALEEMLEELRRVVHGVMLLRETTPRTVDTIHSFGERLSSLILVSAFRESGIHAGLADSRRLVITDATHGAAKPIMEEIERRASDELAPLIAEHDVVVAQGFIGSTLEGVTTTIGRGGSDHTAALLGAATGAPEIQIWTDVDGVMTADPRLVPDARPVRKLTFTEARELAYFGAKVIHPDTILPAVRHNVPVVIKNSMAPEEPGSTIYPDGSDVPPGIHSLTMKRDLLLIELAPIDPGSGAAAIDTAVGTFAQYDVPIECAVIAETRASIVVAASVWNDRLHASLETSCSVSIRKGMALLCLIGSGLRDTPSLLSGPLAALGGISIRLISAGSSDHVILLGLDEDRAGEALVAAHRTLF